MRSTLLMITAAFVACGFPDGEKCTAAAERVNGQCRLIDSASASPDGAVTDDDAGGAPDASDAGDGGKEGDGGSACEGGSCAGVCDPGTGACVECLRNEDCAGNELRRVCAENHTCVECLAASDCKDPNVPHCSEDSTCSTCIGDDDCKRFGMVCEETAESCVECTGNEDCKDGKLCDLGDHTCRGDTGVCEACSNSTQCLVGLDCVATTFNSAPHGSYCLLRAEESRLCPRRFATWSNGICFPDTFTTCEAVLAYQSLCPASAPPDGLSFDCGTANVPGSLCGSDSTCSYPCDSNRDCSEGSVCRGGAVTYCQPGP